jgi:hypothetical protein
VSGVFGAIFVGSGFGWSSLAKSLYDKTNQPGGGCGASDVCTADGLTKRAQARTVGDVATASVVGGSLLVATGVVLFLTAPSSHGEPQAALQVAPDGVRFRGTW